MQCCDTSPGAEVASFGMSTVYDLLAPYGWVEIVSELTQREVVFYEELSTYNNRCHCVNICLTFIVVSIYISSKEISPIQIHNKIDC